jgi:hypothetical protein
MKISAITGARIIALFELNDLYPYGAVSLARITPQIIAKLGFSVFPTSIESFDESKGVTFQDGMWDGLPIEKLTIYNDGIVLDANQDTATSLKILKEALRWAADEFGLSVSERMFNRIRFVSSFAFYSDVPLLLSSSPLANMAQRMSEELMPILGKQRHYEPVRIDIEFDRSEDKANTTGLTIQRRANSPFEENKYYTQAPLPTDVHIALIERFEADVLASRGI